jgi:hypothetical protein
VADEEIVADAARAGDEVQEGLFGVLHNSAPVVEPKRVGYLYFIVRTHHDRGHGVDKRLLFVDTAPESPVADEHDRVHPHRVALTEAHISHAASDVEEFRVVQVAK